MQEPNFGRGIAGDPRIVFPEILPIPSGVSLCTAMAWGSMTDGVALFVAVSYWRL